MTSDLAAHRQRYEGDDKAWPHAARDGRDADRGEPRALDAIIDEGTLTIGWVGPALLGILIAAFGWAGRVFEWLWSLATWLYSEAWRGGGEV